MKVIETASELIAWRKTISEDVGFVPTMGALHNGHVSLIECSKKDNPKTCLSIFVNPTQFNDADDLAKYPRTLKHDLTKCEGIDVVYLPSIEDIYPHGYLFAIHENKYSKVLEGEQRPGHFQGMMTIVLKLLQITRPTRAYFGEKDFQQLLLVEKMCQDFFVDTQIIPCPTVREADGLAISSRNSRLQPEERTTAAKLYDILKSDLSCKESQQALISEGFEVEYVEDWQGRRLAAAYLGSVRLIDNVEKATR